MLLVGGLTLGGDVNRLPHETTTRRDRLTLAFMAQGGALIIAALSLAFTEWLESLSMIALAAGAAAAGARLRARALTWYGLIALAIGSLRILVIDSNLAGVIGVGTLVAGLWLSRWTLLMLGAALLWLITGVVAIRTDFARWRRLAATVLAVAWGLTLMSILGEQAEPRALSIAWLAASTALAFAAPLTQRVPLRWFALGGLAASTLAWLAAYMPWTWSDQAAAIGAHPGLWIALAIGVVGAGLALSVLRRAQGVHGRVGGVIAVSAAVLLIFTATSLEAARGAELLTDDETAQRAMVSIWWGLFALPLMIIGFARRVAPLRHVALALLLIATAKAVLFDLAEVSPEWRVASFIALGLLLLAVAVVYAKRFVEPESEPETAS